jgi:hypothetical protein
MGHLQLGLETMRKIVGDGVSELLSQSTPMRLLFSMISPTPFDDGGPIARAATESFNDSATIGSNGLIIGPKIYPFIPEYQTLFHQRLVEHIMRKDGFSKRAVASLMEMSNMWFDTFTTLSGERIIQVLDSEQAKKVSAVRKEANTYFRGHSPDKFRDVYLRARYPSLNEEKISDLLSQIGQYKIERDELEQTEAEKLRKIVNRMEIPDKDGCGNPIPKRVYEQRLQELKSKQQKENYEVLKKIVEDFSIQFSQDASKRFGIQIDLSDVEARMRKFSDEQFQEDIIKEGIMTREEVYDYLHFRDDVNHFIDRFVEISVEKIEKTDKCVKFLHRRAYSQYRLADVERPFYTANAEPETETGRKLRYEHLAHDSAISRILTSLRRAVAKEAGERYNLNYEGLERYRLNSRAFPAARGLDMDKSIWEIKLIMTGLLHGELPQNVEDMIREYVSLCRNYYNDLYVRYNEAAIQWGRMTTIERKSMNDKIYSLNHTYYENFDVLHKQRVQEIMTELKTKLCETFSEKEGTEQRQLVILPTGIIFIDLEGVDIKGFHPLDKNIRKLMDPRSWEDWKSSWVLFWKKSSEAQHREKFKMMDETIRLLINEFLVSETQNVEPSPLEERLRVIQETYQVSIPELINVYSGKFVNILSEENVRFMERMLPIYGKYIQNISSGEFLVSPDDLDPRVKLFLTTGRDAMTILSIDRNGLTLRVNLASMSIDEGENGSEMFATILGIKLYTMMTEELVKEFYEIVGEKLNISKMDLYRFTGNKIDSMVERRRYMSRIYFLSEFLKYMKGDEVDHGLQDFFANKIDHLTKEIGRR